MARVRFGSTIFDAALVVFDKDGTLFDFTHAWGAMTVAWIEALVQAAAAQNVLSPTAIARLRDDLYRAWGYDPIAKRFAPQGPMVTASLATLRIVAAAVLYQHGFGWLDAELLVQKTHSDLQTTALTPEMFKPFADLPQLFGALQRAGVQVAVVTSDDEIPTRRTLGLLRIHALVDFVSGADSGYGEKPAPEPLLAACRTLGVAPCRTVMVGDSTTDMLMATRAEVGLRVAVTSGIIDAQMLVAQADLVLPSIAAIGVDSTSAVEKFP